MSDLTSLFARPNSPSAPVPAPAAPIVSPNGYERPVAAQFTPAGWQGDTTRHHGFPLPADNGAPKPPPAKWGRYDLPHPETGKTQKFSRVTTLAGALDDKAGLTKWLQRNVVAGLKRDPDLLEHIDLFGEPSDVNKDIDAVIEHAGVLAGGSEASERGTAIHAWTEAVERDGVPLEQVPADFRPSVTAYVETLAAHGVSTVPGMVERLVWHRASGYVGTLDRIYQLADGTRVIGDVKTSKDLKFGYLSFAIQTYLYATADAMYDPESGMWVDMPPVGDLYSVIAWIPSNRPGFCQLVTLDLGMGKFGVDMAVELQEMRKSAHKTVPGQWELPVPGAPVLTLEDMIDACTSQGELAQLWESHKDVWRPEHTQRGMSAVNATMS